MEREKRDSLAEQPGIKYYIAPQGHRSARLAQSVEHGTLNPRVVGSSPTSGALFFLSIFLFFLPFLPFLHLH